MNFPNGYLVSVRVFDKKEEERTNYISRFFISSEDSSVMKVGYQVSSGIQNAVIFPYRELPFLKKLLDRIVIDDRKDMEILRLDVKPSKTNYLSEINK